MKSEGKALDSISAVNIHLQEAYQNIIALYRFSADLIICRNRKEIFVLLCELIRNIIQYHSCIVLLHDDDSGVLKKAHSTQGAERLIEHVGMWQNSHLLEYTGATEGISVMPVGKNDDIYGNSYLSIPLAEHARKIGFIILETDRKETEITKQQLDLLHMVTAHATIAIINSILYNNLQKKNMELTKLSQALQRSQDKLQAFNLKLEKKVKQRTEEIEITNQKLEVEHRKLLVANQELEQLNVKLKDLDSAKTKFFTSISHELRTPLNAIIGFSEALLDEIIGRINSKQKKYVNNILSNGKNLLKMINEILELARLESVKLKLSIESVSLEKLLKDSEELIRPLLKKKNLLFSIVTSGDLEEVKADPSKLMQVMHNLLSNAVKFTPEKGEIVISAWRADATMIHVAVIDNGLGIPAKYREEIFEEFSLIRQPEISTEKGTGLGLSICRKLVNIHGGEIWVDSPPLKQYGVYRRDRNEGGSAFIFTLRDRSKSMRE